MRAKLMVFAFTLAASMLSMAPMATSQAPISEGQLAFSIPTSPSKIPSFTLKTQYPMCPDNGYASQRTGYGACGQFCQTTRNGQFSCPTSTRPIYLKNGDCTCCPFQECH